MFSPFHPRRFILGYGIFDDPIPRSFLLTRFSNTCCAGQKQAFVGFKILSEEETADADSGAVDVGPSLLVALLFGMVAVAHP
jgi:hypothetical protein